MLLAISNGNDPGRKEAQHHDVKECVHRAVFFDQFQPSVLQRGHCHGFIEDRQDVDGKHGKIDQTGQGHAGCGHPSLHLDPAKVKDTESQEQHQKTSAQVDDSESHHRFFQVFGTRQEDVAHVGNGNKGKDQGKIYGKMPMPAKDINKRKAEGYQKHNFVIEFRSHNVSTSPYVLYSSTFRDCVP